MDEYNSVIQSKNSEFTHFVKNVVQNLPKEVYVVAGTYSQFIGFLRVVQPYGIVVRYVRDLQSLKGVHNIDVVYYGTWGYRDDLREIDEALHLCGVNSEMEINF
jgi:hypothetical protein